METPLEMNIWYFQRVLTKPQEFCQFGASADWLEMEFYLSLTFVLQNYIS